MFNLLQFFILFVVTMLCSSCSNSASQEKSSATVADYTVLEPQDSLFFELDSLTSPYTTYSQLYKGSYVHLNNFDSSLYFFDLKTSKIKKIWKPNKDARGVVGKFAAFHIMNDDSVYVFTATNYKAFLLDGSGKLLNTHQLSETSIFCNNFVPIYLIDDNFYFALFFNNNFMKPYKQDKGNALGIYSLKEKKTNYALEYPTPYTESAYGSTYNYYSYTYNADKNQFVFSFAAAGHLVVMNLPSLMTQFVLPKGRSIATDVPAPDKYLDDQSRMTLHQQKHHLYQGIIYDSYRKIYYQSIQLPNPDAKQGVEPSNPLLLCILDSNFKMIQEFLLPHRYYANFFISEEGFFIPRVYTEDEDVIVFDKFVLPVR